MTINVSSKKWRKVEDLNPCPCYGVAGFRDRSLTGLGQPSVAERERFERSCVLPQLLLSGQVHYRALSSLQIGARDRIRTCKDWHLKPACLPIAPPAHGPVEWIRTTITCLLRAVRLPIASQRETGGSGRNRTSDVFPKG